MSGVVSGLGVEPSRGDSDSYTGLIPVTAEVGWRINPNISIGAVFQYAYGLVKSSAHNCDPYRTGRNSCWGSDLFLGAESVYHFMPKTGVDPWAGVGTGYEWLGFGSSDLAAYGTVYAKGFQFINLHFGIDFPVAPGFYVAPFLTFALGEYTKFGHIGSKAPPTFPPPRLTNRSPSHSAP